MSKIQDYNAPCILPVGLSSAVICLVPEQVLSGKHRVYFKSLPASVLIGRNDKESWFNLKTTFPFLNGNSMIESLLWM